ncbi:hypothetical protein Trydic_g3596 [Trypoxylus dichotomus]
MGIDFNHLLYHEAVLHHVNTENESCYNFRHSRTESRQNSMYSMMAAIFEVWSASRTRYYCWIAIRCS